jgi:TolA-binding protein
MFMIPIVAIIGGLTVGVIQAFIKSSERRMELQLLSRQGADDAARQQLEALRTEVAQLRDTTTQFAMSIEQTVTRLDQRVARIEAGGTHAQTEAAPVQPLSGR